MKHPRTLVSSSLRNAPRFSRTASRRRPLICAASIALLAGFAVEKADAGVLYWDDNGTTTGTSTAPNGIWGVDNFWNATQAGTGGGGGVYYQGSDAVIAASNTATGAYTVTVSGSIFANSLGINRGTPTLAGTSSPALTLGSGGLYLPQGSSTSGVGGAVTLAASLGTITLGATQNWANNITSAALHELFVNAGVQGSGPGTTTLNLTSLAAANFGNNLGNVVFNGVLSDGTGGGRLALNVNGVGNSGTTLAAANTFTGGVTMNSGTMRVLATSGSLNSANALTFTGNSLFNYDNTGTILALNQNLAGLSFTRGEGTVQSNRVAAQTLALNFTGLSQSAGATANFLAIGGINGTDNKIALAGQATGFLNQRTFFGTAAGIANNYAFYDAAGFVRGIDYGIDANTSLIAGGTDIVAGGGVAGQYVRTTGAISAQTSLAINTLNITGASNFTLDPAATLTLTNGGLLKSSAAGAGTAATISSGVGITTGGATELVIRADQTADNLTITTPILASSTGGVTKAGAGTVSLASGGVNAYSGATTINAGTFSLLGSDVIPNGSAVNIRGGNLNQNNSANGGILAIGANNDTVGAVQLQGGAITGTTGVLTGTSYDVRSGLITGILGGAGVGLTKNGVGMVLIASASGPQQYTGATTVNGGLLTINFTAAQPTNTISASSPLVLGGGVLNPVSNVGSVTQVQGFASTTLNQGDSTASPGRSGASSTIRTEFGAFARNTGGTLNIQGGTNVVFLTTSANTASGILGNAITFGGTEWARNTGVTGGATYTNAFAANTQNTDMSASITATADATTGSLRFNSFAANTLTLSGNNVIESGGILVTNATLNNVSTITGGTSLTSGNGRDLIVINNNASGPIAIASNIVDASGGATPIALTKAGQGTLIVSGTNSFTGGIFINNGVLAAASAGALGAGNDLNFGGSSGTGNFGGFNFSTPTLQLGGNNAIIGTLSMDNASVGTPVIENASAVAATLTTNSSASKTYAGILRDGTGGGALGFSKAGGGTLTLANENTHSGETVSFGGTLALAHSLALSKSTLNYNNQGGAVSFTTLNAATLGGLAGAQNLALTNAGAGAVALTVGGNGANTTYTGVLSGTGSAVTKIGNGTLTLSGANTYTGGTTVSAGTLKVNNVSGSATGSGTVFVGNGATLGGTGTISGAVTIASGGTLAAGNSVGTLNLGSVSISAGAILKYEFKTGPAANDLVNVTNAGGLTINGGSFFLYAENTTSKWLNAGTYHLFQFNGAIGGAGVAAFTPASILNPQAGLTYAFGTSGSFVDLTITGFPTLTSAWTAPGGGTWGATGNWSNGVPNFTGQTANFLASIGAPSTVTLDGNKKVGTIEFDNAFDYTIAQGTGGTLQIDNGGPAALIKLTTGSHAISAPVSLLSNTAVEVVNANKALTVSGAISGAGNLAKNGPGTLALAGANGSFTGNTALNSGTIEVAHTQALGTGTLTMGAGTTLRASAGGLAPANNVVIGTGVTATVDTQANVLTLGGVVSDISGDGALTKTGSGILVVAADATYAGLTTVSNGTLHLGNGGSAGSVAGPILNNGALVFNRSDVALAINSPISGTGTLSQIGTGTATLNAVNSFTGDTTIFGGVLVLGNALALQTSRLNYNNQGGVLSFGTLTAATIGNLTGAQLLELSNDAAQAVALTVGNGQTNTFSGQITDGLAFGGSITKTGLGTLNLSGVNSYTGSTTVNAGTLALNAGGVINGGAMQVNAGGTMTVNGGALQASVVSNVQNSAAGPATFNISSGSATFNGGLNALGNQNQNWFINATGGTLTAASMSFGRSALSYTVEPTAGSTTTGLYINGATVIVTGGLSMATSNQTNSSVSTRIDSGSLTVGGTTTIGLNNAGRWSVLDINGGTFTSTDVTNGVIIGAPQVGNAELLVRAGTATVEIIKMGQAASGTSVLNLTGGSLYIGSGGIVQNSAVTSVIKLAGGTLGATADWASTLDMQVNGGATVKAADAANVAHDITLGGALSGAGTLTKTGAGKLTLAGAQSYSALLASEGRTDVSGSFITGTSNVTVASNAIVNFGADQTLGALDIGDGAVVTIGAPLPPAPPEAALFAEPAFVGAAAFADTAAGSQAVPEPGSAALLLGGMLTLLGLRRRA